MKKAICILMVLALVLCVSCVGTKQVWNGAWNGGSVNVNPNDFSVFRVELEYGAIVVVKNGNVVEGSGAYGFLQNSVALYALKIAVHGNTWTIIEAKYIIQSNGKPNAVADSDMRIVAIYGID